MIASVNPATGEVLARFDLLDEAQLDQKLTRARAAFLVHRQLSFGERRAAMLRAADILEDEKDQLARIMTLEMGKTLRSAVQEAEKCAFVCRYYAERAEEMLARERVEIGARASFVVFQPLGVVLAVMPWNFPFWQAFRFLAPALMAGNVALLKHASNVPQCALAIERVLAQAGFVDGVMQTLLIGSDAVAHVIADPRVAAVTLTGSEPAGSQVAAEAGRRIKKSLLELGGSDPFVVTATADVTLAAEVAVMARTTNNGQSCIAAKRFIVERAVAGEFEEHFVARMKTLKVGDPLDAGTDVGPLATPAGVATLSEQVRRSVELGARIACGGHAIAGPGNFFEPTVLVDPPKGSPAYSEELFGPVAALFRVDNLDEAIALANDTEFGLGASVWSRDEREQTKAMYGIEAGMVFINAMTASDPRIPFGGVKHSGYGREMAREGIREFVNAKTVVIR